MKSRNDLSLLGVLLGMVCGVLLAGCSGGSSTPPLPISVSLSPATTLTLDQGQSASLMATVTNDSANKGVSWTVSCSSPSCGTVSPSTSASGASVKYTAPTPVTANLAVNVTATSVADPSKSMPGNVTVSAPPALAANPPTVPAATVGQNYSLNLMNFVTGGAGSTNWSIKQGSPALPGGLSLNSNTGVVSGTPTSPTTSAAVRAVSLARTRPEVIQPVAITFVYTDSGNPPQSVDVTISLTVNAQPLTITSATTATGTMGAAFNFTVTASGGVPPYAFSSTGLPTGLSIDPNSGLISGTLNTSGTIVVNLTVTSTDPATATGTLTITVPAITVSVSPGTATVAAGSSAPFKATVSNDGANKGVTWSVSCSTAPCGAVSPTSTASGAPTTYTAPVSAGTLTVTLTATSVEDGTKTAAATITVPTITVSVLPGTATVTAGGTAQFSATVTGDAANKGVTWTVTCSNAPCGSVSPATTASGAATTYTAATPAGTQTVTLTATSVTEPAATSSATITVNGITVSVAPPSASVPSGGTQQFTATVNNDPNNSGVNWSMVEALRGCTSSAGRDSCGPVYYSLCGTACGTVSPTPTPSGAPTTYTAPAHFTPPVFPEHCKLGFCTFTAFLGVFIQANSVTNTGAQGLAGITILPISVSVSPSPVSVALSAAQQFTATVTNDGSNSGVTWTLTQNGAACSPGCGTMTPASTASGAPATYNAPATAPDSAAVSVTVTSAEDTTKSSNAAVILKTATGALACGAETGNESLLQGQYAFLLQGSDPGDQVVMAGSFTADGAGRITAGETDAQRTVGPVETDVSINASLSAYAVGPDHRGCLVLADASGEAPILRFALGSINASDIATIGHVVEVGDAGGFPAPVAGTLRLQDATSFAANQFKGAYAYGVLGFSGGRFAMAGTFSSDGVSALTSSDFDSNAGGTVTSNQSSSPGGTFTCCSTSGRGTLNLSNANAPVSAFVIYMINSGVSFLMSDAGFAGEALAIPSGTAFTQASLNGAAVLRGTGLSSNGPIVDIALATADGKSAMTVNDNINNAGTFTSISTALNFIVAANGRVALTGGSNPPVVYLYGENQGFLVSTDANATFGILESQTAGPFSDSSFSGAYIFGTENSSASSVTIESGVLTADGNGNASGTSDQSTATGSAPEQSLSFTYSFPANGVGNVGSGTTAILISGNKLVFINNTSAAPTVTVVEK